MRAAIRGGGVKGWLFSASSERIMSGSSGMSSLGCNCEATTVSSESECELSMALDMMLSASCRRRSNRKSRECVEGRKGRGRKVYKPCVETKYRNPPYQAGGSVSQPPQAVSNQDTGLERKARKDMIQKRKVRKPAIKPLLSSWRGSGKVVAGRGGPAASTMVARLAVALERRRWRWGSSRNPCMLAHQPSALSLITTSHVSKAQISITTYNIYVDTHLFLNRSHGEKHSRTPYHSYL